MAPKPALLVSHIDRLKSFSPTIHKSIIFDDMNFKRLHREAQIHITDTNDARDIHIRYGIVHIPAKTPKIFTGNYLMFNDDPAILRRINKFDYT
jgi:hypothetical protein